MLLIIAHTCTHMFRIRIDNWEWGMCSNITSRNDRSKRSEMFRSWNDLRSVWDVKRWSCPQLLCCSGAKPTHSIRFCKHFINTVSTSQRPATSSKTLRYLLDSVCFIQYLSSLGLTWPLTFPHSHCQFI